MEATNQSLPRYPDGTTVVGIVSVHHLLCTCDDCTERRHGVIQELHKDLQVMSCKAVIPKGPKRCSLDAAEGDKNAVTGMTGKASGEGKLELLLNFTLGRKQVAEEAQNMAAESFRSTKDNTYNAADAATKRTKEASKETAEQAGGIWQKVSGPEPTVLFAPASRLEPSTLLCCAELPLPLDDSAWLSVSLYKSPSKISSSHGSAAHGRKCFATYTCLNV